MSKKVLTIRLPEDKHQELIGKIGDNSINSIFERLTDLIINETISINPQGIHFRQQSDSNLIADNQSYQSDSNLTALSEVEDIKKQIDSIMTALELKGNSSNRLDSIEDKVKQLDSKVIALSDRQHCDCKVIAVEDRQQSDSIVTALDENQLDLIFDEDKPVVVTENLETIDISESEGINDSNNNDLPSNIEIESIENTEGTITPEAENDELKSENKRAKKNDDLKPLPQEFLELPMGNVKASTLTKAFGYKASSSISRIGKKECDPQFEGFWDYLAVSTDGKKLVWEKIK